MLEDSRWSTFRHIMDEDADRVLTGNLPLEQLHNTTVLVTGGAGMLPSCFALTLLIYRRSRPDCGLDVFILVRNIEAAKRRYACFWDEPYFHIIQADVCGRISDTYAFDYIVHGASPADPRRFGENPSGVFLPNVLGTHQILEASIRSNVKGVLFMSSGEVYGRLPEDVKTVHESGLGLVDPLDLRSCYAEGKRAGETLCKIYAEQYHVPAKIVRISHTFGPTMDIYRDSRVFAEFTRCVVEHRNIQLKSDGSAVRPFCYTSDCVDGMLRVLLMGEIGQAYNLAGDEYYSVLELAELLCRIFPERHLSIVKTVRPSGDKYMEAVKQSAIRVDTSRLKSLGWQPRISVAAGFRRTIMSIEEDGKVWSNK